MHAKFLAGLLAVLPLPALAAAEDPRAPVPVTPADVSHYDCAAAAGPAAKGSVHIGQVILGRYYEWNEIYGGDAGDQLLCIGMRVPEARSLTAAEAKTFLAQSAAIGAPTPAAASTPGLETQASDLNAVPEPPKRVRKDSPQTPATDLPPVPAEHRPGDPNIPNAVAPVPEKPAATPPQPNAWEKSAAGDPRSEIAGDSILSYPYNTIGYFTVTYPNNGSFRCTGTLVSAYVVLTAGHCVHNNSRGGWVTAVRFYPAQYISTLGNLTRPYGSNTALANLKTTQNWTEISGPDEFAVRDYRYDYAAIQFSQAFTHTSTFMPVVYGSTIGTANNAGYPGNLKDSTATEYGMFFASGTETQDSLLSLRSSHVREFSVYSSGGDSGGPFWYLDSQNRRGLMGSLSYSSDDGTSSGGPWYDSNSQNLISSWVSWTPTSSVATLPTTGLKVGSVISTASTASQSFLRFYNSSTVAATVSVTLSDYATGTPLAQWTSPQIAPGSSPQFAISTIEAAATPSFNKPAYYSLAIQSGFTGSFQHVLWRITDGSLTNLSTCDALPTTRTTLINVHSSLLQSGYPSQVVVFNTGTVTANASLGIYDAATGTRIGSYAANGVPANGQVMITITNLENSAGISPNGRYHYNIKIENAFPGYLQHLVNNQQAGVTTDMTTVCPLVRSTG